MAMVAMAGDEGFLARDSSEYPHALIAYGDSRHSPTLWAASNIAARLELADFIVDLGDASKGAMPPPPDYDLVIVSVTCRPQYDRPLYRWIHDFAPNLDELTTGVVVLGQGRKYTRTLAQLSRCGWQPPALAALPDHARVPGEALALLERFVHQLAMIARGPAMGEQHRTSRFAQ
jgi:hypothetical protein